MYLSGNFLRKFLEMDYLPIYTECVKYDQSLSSVAASLKSASIVRMALERLLAPVSRLALSFGLKYQELDEILRGLLVREAEQAMRARPDGRLNTSQMSVMTGLQRKEINRLQALAARGYAEDGMSGASRSLASQVLLRWVEELDTHPERVLLPVLPAIPSRANSLSFAQLAASVVTDVHHRATLDELIRLGLVREEDGMVQLLSDAFVPRHAPADRLVLMAQNAAAHLNTGVDNLDGSNAPRLEQAIWGEGISLADCARLDGVARKAWLDAHRTLFREISDTPEVPAGEVRHRVRIGMYVHCEPITSEGETN
jgi:Family of unknown function (DUF6502)